MRILYPGISSNLFVIELRHGKDNTLIISIFSSTTNVFHFIQFQDHSKTKIIDDTMSV